MIRLPIPRPKVQLEARISPHARTWRNRPEVNRWCRQFSDISPGAHSAWLKRQRHDPTVRMFTVVETKSNNDVGVCGLTSISHVNQSAEFSLYIDPEEQKRGYGHHALVTLIDHGFTALNLHRIWGEVFDGNPAASLFKAIGFTHEGTLRESYFRNGRYIDSTIISLLRSEWIQLPI